MSDQTQSGGFSIKVRVNPNNVPEALEAAIARGSFEGMERLAVRCVFLVQAHTPVAQGILVNSVEEIVQLDGKNIVATIFSGPPADVYAPPVEYGTQPHFPPPSALVPWVMKRFSPKNEKEALSIAFAIAKNIAKRGTKGAHMFGMGLDQLEPEAQGIMEVALARSLEAAGFGAAQ